MAQVGNYTFSSKAQCVRGSTGIESIIKSVGGFFGGKMQQNEIAVLY